MRTLVRLIKSAITGCGACLLIASSTQLQFGGVTHALDNDILTGPNAVPAQVPAQISYVLDNELPLDEAAMLAMFPPEPMEEPITEPVYERPSLAVPEGWVGNAITFDGDGNPSLYGTEIASMTAKTVFGTPAASERAEDTYFSEDTLFIGNSLVVGMQKTAAINTTYYANIGMSVKQFFEKPMMIAPDGEKNADGSPKIVTTAEALVRNNDFRRVYLMFGVNELGWVSTSTFIDYYETLIDLILNVRPDAVIYVQEMLPINEADYQAKNDPAHDYFNNARIATFNESIKALAARKSVVYLTPAEVLVDETGGLPASATTDGIHLNASYIRRWADNLYTHTVDDVDPALFYQPDEITE